MSADAPTNPPATDNQLNLDDPDFIRDPRPTYRWLIENSPYRWGPTETVIFSRHAEVKALLQERRFTNDYRTWEFAKPIEGTFPDPDWQMLIENGLNLQSFEDHRRVRKLTTYAFSPRSIGQLRGDIQDAVDRMIDIHVKGDTVNLQTFAHSLPMEVLGGIFKIPPDVHEDFRQFGESSVKSLDISLSPAELFGLMGPTPHWMEMLRKLVRDRTENPLDNDLLSVLIAARDGGDKLSEGELLALIQGLITAGQDSTENGILWAVDTLLRHPEAVAEVQGDPELLRNAVEETLRYNAGGKLGLPKFSLEDMEFCGAKLRKGQMVYPCIPAAGHDPEVFPEPDRFDIHRDLRNTVSFGAGRHICLGIFVARAQIDIAVGTLLRRFPNMKVIGEPEFKPHPLMRSIARLDVSLA